jgi:hypothetical protein
MMGIDYIAHLGYGLRLTDEGYDFWMKRHEDGTLSEFLEDELCDQGEKFNVVAVQEWEDGGWYIMVKSSHRGVDWDYQGRSSKINLPVLLSNAEDLRGFLKEHFGITEPELAWHLFVEMF